VKPKTLRAALNQIQDMLDGQEYSAAQAECQYCRGEKNGNAQDTSRSTTPDSSDAHQAEV